MTRRVEQTVRAAKRDGGPAYASPDDAFAGTVAFSCVSLTYVVVAVTPLTVLVGKNESGKTALLKALHKFNPFKPEPYATREWPRGHRDARSADQVVSLLSSDNRDARKVAALALSLAGCQHLASALMSVCGSVSNETIPNASVRRLSAAPGYLIGTSNSAHRPGSHLPVRRSIQK